jgi:DNA-binding NtrC family response regulator
MPPRVLLVEPNAHVAATLRAAGRALGTIDHHVTFETARESLIHQPVDFVITNLRLSEFNGLHLVHLVASHVAGAKCIVYTDRRDPALAREVQRAGAFYETAECLPVTMAAYLRGNLPDLDRRDPQQTDRRGLPRGGRRCWDNYAQQR